MALIYDDKSDEDRPRKKFLCPKQRSESEYDSDWNLIKKERKKKECNRKKKCGGISDSDDDDDDDDDDARPRKKSARKRKKPAAKSKPDYDDGPSAKQKHKICPKAVISSSEGSDSEGGHRSCRDMSSDEVTRSTKRRRILSSGSESSSSRSL